MKTSSKLALWLLLSCNGLDAGLTVALIRLGYATEANPFLAPILAWSPVTFVLVKFSLIMGVVAWLSAHHQARLPRLTLQGASLAYLGIVLWSVSHL
jgi:hypothetical protein